MKSVYSSLWLYTGGLWYLKIRVGYFLVTKKETDKGTHYFHLKLSVPKVKFDMRYLSFFLSDCMHEDLGRLLQ